MDIPDFSNDDHRDLIENLLNGCCIFFGAGISKLANYKLWEELKNELVIRFWDRRSELKMPDIDEFDYSLRNYLFECNELDAMNFLYNIDKKMFTNEVKSIFTEDQVKEKKEPFDYLNRINFRDNNFFVTTNIDTGLQRYLGLDDTLVSIVPDFNNPPKKISFLHGRLDKDASWVLTGKNYLDNYYGITPYCMNFIKYIFENYTVIFVGYGLRDKEILDAVGLTKKRRKHYWLESSYRGKKDYLLVRATALREYNIQLIPYLIDNHGPMLLNEVLNAIYKELAKH